MTRGGARKGAGRKPRWIHGKTRVVRVPEALADRVLELAQLIDEGHPVGDTAKAKCLNLAGIRIVQIGSKSAILLSDLIRAGFTIYPHGLADRVQKEMGREG